MNENAPKGLTTRPWEKVRPVILGVLATIGVLGLWIVFFSRAGTLASLLGPLAPALCSDPKAHDPTAVIAFAWGDGKYGRAFYGVQVYTEPLQPGYRVRARIHLGPGNAYFRDCGVIGQAQSWQEAVARWGKIEFCDEGVRIGTGQSQFFLPRTELERHR